MRKNGFKVKAKKGKESEKREEMRKNVEKVRKRFWWRWLSFVRGHWPGQGALRREGGSKSAAAALHSLRTASESNATSTDVIEIPIEPGQKISKILIKPTRTGIKAMIAQCRTPLCASKTPRADKWSPSEDASWDGRTLGQSDAKFSEECGQARDRSANWRTEIFKNEAEVTGRKETLLTSALFIREDMDNIVESAVFIEPNLPNDYPDSKKSDDLSQKSIKINKRRISYRIVDERNDEIRKTIKTISEPTWMERKNILRRQRLHENINNLLEQFMFLESEDIVGLTIPQSRPAQDRKTVHFGGASSQGTGGHPQKEISREVSPEILVNKKPFKEYLSDDYFGMRGSSHGEKQNQRSTDSPNRMAKKSKTTRERIGRAEEYECPILNEVLVSEECNYVDALKSYSGFGGGMQRISAMEREMMRRTCYGDCEELAELASLRCIEKDESPMCTIWGVCKTYSACNKTLKGEVTAAECCAIGTGKESLDELLETLDDSDHDVVFQKNISQFRKKINVVPRLDLRKSNARVTDAKKAEHKKMKRPQNYLELIKPIIECVVEESEEEEREDRARAFQALDKRTTGALSVWSVEKWANERKSHEVFVTNFLLFTEWNIVRRALSNRTEEAMVKIVGSIKEMYSLTESSTRTVVQREKAASYERLREVHLICTTGNEVPESPEKLDFKNVKAISLMLGIEGDDFSLAQANELALSKEEIPQALSLFSNTTECFYVIQGPRFPSFQQLNGCDPRDSRLSKESDGNCSEKLAGRLNGELRKDATEQTGTGSTGRSVLKFSEPTVRISSRACLGTPLQRYSELDFRENAAEMRSVRSDCSAGEGSNAVGDLEKRFSFQILYNNDKESLNDDDEEAMRTDSVKSLGERIQNVVSSGKELESKDIQKEEEENKGGICSDEGGRTSRIMEKKWNKFLKYKSSSSPRENIIQNELGSQEHRARRSLIFLKEIEKDFQNCKKRRLSGDKGAEIRRTGSALLELHSPKLGQSGPFLQKKSSFGEVKTFASLILPEELIVKPDRDQKTLDSMKMLVTDGGGPNVRKEVIAAFNSIKELGACKGEAKGGNKRMSLVIMLSKK